jgi:hypothetical protein
MDNRKKKLIKLTYGVVRKAQIVDELEDFKTNINLTEYAAGQGYVLDKKASSKNSAVMRKPDGDKIIIARRQNQHWIYFSVRDDSDNGSIIDFVQKRKGLKLGRVRQELRRWVGGSWVVARPHPDLFAQEIEPISKDRTQVLLDLARMKPLVFHRYLEEERCVPRSLLQSQRFAGKIKTDYRNNTIFPHADQDGPCGYEIKNKGFTGFAPGGEKGLWFSAARKEDTALVIAESGIDALSYGALFPDENARYASIGGAMNPGQPMLISSAIQKMPQGARVILAMDNDGAGRDLADQIEALAEQAGRADLTLLRHLPEGEGDDWNDVLRAGREAEAPVPAALP